MTEITWPTVVILIVTYDRPQEIRATILGLIHHLSYRGQLLYAVCDDGSPEGYLQGIHEAFPDLQIAFSTTKRQGWGANVNVGIRTLVHKNYCFLTEDDQVALTKIDLTSGVALLEALPDLGAIRYDGVAGHALNLELREAETAIGRMNYLRILKSSPHLNVYSNRPHLAAPRFHEVYGTYLVGKTLGQTEESFAHKVRDQEGPDIGCLTDGIALAFDHIGKSRQNTTEDVHHD